MISRFSRAQCGLMVETMINSGWKVHKFGGSSLTDEGCFRQVADILLAGESAQQAVVVSAMGGKTDALLDIVAAAEASGDGIDIGLASISRRYCDTIEKLISDPERSRELLEHFNRELSDAADILQSVALVRSAADRSRDLVASYGELWSARLLAAYLDERTAEDEGPGVRMIDARELIVVKHGEMGPAVMWQQSQHNAEAIFGGDRSRLAVVTGFIASDSDGLATTLGRNGSDYSASILAALLSAESVTIWTDVDGVMSADPNRVPDSAVIDSLTYNEAMELAYFGAKVIHPQTMSPVIQRDIPIRIRNTFNPAVSGSTISADGAVAGGVKGITSIDEVALINLEGAGMIGVPGTADRLFGALRSAGVSVILISQASSEHSICFAVPGDSAAQTEDVVKHAFAAELDQGLIQSVGVQSECSVVAVVGDGMAGLPGIAAKFFGTLGNAGINVKAIAQGSSERNISAVIDRTEVTRALRAAHSGFYLSAKTLSVGLIGPGNVGSVLLDQMAAQADRLRTEFSLDFRIRAIATSSRMHLSENAVDLRTWRESFAQNNEELDWQKFAAHVDADYLPHAAMVDCSASALVADRYSEWFARGIHVVTPNKKALSGALKSFDELHNIRRQQGAHFLYEATVGAGLPVIETLRDLRQTGDTVHSIEGIFSGTLAYLFNVYDSSKPFSTIVREARDNGYTEPDPRDDLSGMDVARKLIILAREMGMRLELADLEVESLVPESLISGSSDEFLAELPQFDAAIAERWRAADNAGKILRYVGRLNEDRTATVRLDALPRDHQFGHMNLTDNIVRFVTERYSDNPLVVQGPGAGPAVTAAGVFADLLRLAAYLGASR